MVDIHCHILPGFDDGSDNFEESLRMARIAAGGGTKAIIVTPHCNISSSHKNYFDKLYVDNFKELKARIKEQRIPLEIYPGHEIFATDDMIDPIKKKRLLTLCNSDYPLIEFAFKERSDSVYRKLRLLVAEGLTPIVAHPERYAFVAEDRSSSLRLKKIGCLLQLNKGSLKNKFGDNAYAISQALIRHELADFVASDAHSPYMRTPYLADAYEIVCDLHSEQYADILLKSNPQKVLNNEKIK
ncbi:MAG: CpsB/CapC family capsule biosynthesis tyrosine phosphatase [Acutalibacteraceae bacterium]|nr:CpsB/CapC family capsule biosynthesis tyrosine phosphatase [Acutalibacteraceae bacterium]